MARTRSPADFSFDARYGRLIRKAGIATVPFALFHYQGELGLEPQHTWLITYVLAFRWTADLPYPAIREIVRRSGVTSKTIQKYKTELMAKGYLRTYRRVRADGGNSSLAWDFSPLFEEIDRLISRDLDFWTRRNPQFLEEETLLLPEGDGSPTPGEDGSPGDGEEVSTGAGREGSPAPPAGRPPAPGAGSPAHEEDQFRTRRSEEDHPNQTRPSRRSPSFARTRPATGTPSPNGHQSPAPSAAGLEALLRALQNALGSTDQTALDPARLAQALQAMTAAAGAAPAVPPGPGLARPAEGQVPPALAEAASAARAEPPGRPLPPGPAWVRIPEAGGIGGRELWTAVQQLLAEWVSPTAYQTYIEPCRLMGREGATLLLVAPNSRVRLQLTTGYRDLLDRAIASVAGQPLPWRVLTAAEWARRSTTEQQGEAVSGR